jgi:predicted  nucleic acid-binding Zn-ribbon protein
MSGENNGWSEYSKLVLKELETLAGGIESLRSELHDMKQELTAIRAKEDKVDELRAWKVKIDDIVSPSQLKSLVKEIQELKTFKTKAITIFAGIQFLMALAVLVSRFIK